jgi:oligopeptide transport system substrate-binding protein
VGLRGGFAARLPPLMTLRLALLALVAAWLAACSAGPAPDGPPATDELARGNGAEPDSLDPQLARMDSALTILRDAYEGLTSVGRDGGVEPGVAEDWQVSDDGRSYRFRLRADARWSNGEPVEAADFTAAWQRLVDPETASQYAQMLEPVGNARAIIGGRAPPSSLGVTEDGPHTLVVRLERPTAHFLALLSHPSTFPVHRASLAAGGTAFARPGRAVTNGPYVPVEWQVGAFVRAERNPHYRDAASTAIGAVRYHHVSDPGTELTRYRAGGLDVTYTLPAGQLARWPQERRDELHSGPQLGIYYYGFAVDRPPFRDNAKLRLALAMAVDREILVGKVLGDGEIAAYGWVPPGIAGYEPQRFAWAGWSAERRLAEARRLYAEAGYSSANPATFELSYNKSPLHDRIALAVSAMWKQWLGAQVTLRAEEFRVLKQTIDSRDVAAFRGSWIADYNDAYSFLQVLRGGFGINLPRYASARYDALLDEAALADGDERATLLAAAEQQLLEDAPLVPLFFYVSKHLVSPRVAGWYDNVMNVTYSRHLRLDTGAE